MRNVEDDMIKKASQAWQTNDRQNVSNFLPL